MEEEYYENKQLHQPTRNDKLPFGYLRPNGAQRKGLETSNPEAKQMTQDQDLTVRALLETLVAKLSTPKSIHDSPTMANEDPTGEGQTLYTGMGIYTIDNLRCNTTAYTTPKVQVQDRKQMYWS